jgi:hypothetical protein
MRKTRKSHETLVGKPQRRKTLDEDAEIILQLSLKI